MNRGRGQQAVAALAVLLVIAATVAGGFILTLGEGRFPSAERNPTATSYVIPTIGSPQVEDNGPTVVRPDEEEIMEQQTPTATRTLRPTPTDVWEDGDAASGGMKGCQVRPEWVAYTVKSGESLAQIGRRYGLSADVVQRGSCLGRQAVAPGDVVFVPAATPTLTPPASDDIQPTGTQSATDGACTNPDSVIAMPKVGAVLSGSIGFYGTARLPDFSYYKLEIRPEASSAQDYVTFYTGEAPVLSDLLYQFDTLTFPNGSYWIRLVVVNITGNYPERCARLYTIQN